jgi:hypothetical protein
MARERYEGRVSSMNVGGGEARRESWDGMVVVWRVDCMMTRLMEREDGVGSEHEQLRGAVWLRSMKRM